MREYLNFLLRGLRQDEMEVEQVAPGYRLPGQPLHGEDLQLFPRHRPQNHRFPSPELKNYYRRFFPEYFRQVPTGDPVADDDSGPGWREALEGMAKYQKASQMANLQKPLQKISGRQQDVKNQRDADSHEHVDGTAKETTEGKANREGTGERRGSISEADSDDDNEEGDYTVYECPGLAPFVILLIGRNLLEIFLERKARMILDLPPLLRNLALRTPKRIDEEGTNIETLAPRGTLCKFILVYGPMKEYSAKRWFRQLILAIVYLHTMDIAHRDISCDNILITSGYNIKLCDFGYSCFSLRRYFRLANLRKRHAMKGRGDGSLLPLYSFASKTSAATQGGSPPGTSWGTPDSNKKFNHWRNTDPDESDTSFNLKYQQLLGKKQSRFNPERRSTCVVS
ncbi:unnamed protein product [Nesidiocoris tenuis]|uniref:Protein kinase domain-containing protein n=1 Tax=Nesidiocoris tenuis TaxID=355587 RepID=A0A6H5HPB3_9HEMI|nr:unnamed protein product [Nesidiocoris tenuis]